MSGSGYQSRPQQTARTLHPPVPPAVQPAYSSFSSVPPPPGTPSPAIGPVAAPPVNGAPPIPPRPPGYELRGQATTGILDQPPHRPSSKVYTSFPPPPGTPQPPNRPGNGAFAPPVLPSRSSPAISSAHKHAPTHPSPLQVSCPQGFSSFPQPKGLVSLTPLDLNNLPQPPPGPPSNPTVPCRRDSYTASSSMASEADSDDEDDSDSDEYDSDSEAPPTSPPAVYTPLPTSTAATTPELPKDQSLLPQTPADRHPMRPDLPRSHQFSAFPPPPIPEEPVEIEDVKKRLQSMSVKTKAKKATSTVSVIEESGHDRITSRGTKISPHKSSEQRSRSDTKNGAQQRPAKQQSPMKQQSKAPSLLASHQPGPDQGLDGTYYGLNREPTPLSSGVGGSKPVAVTICLDTPSAFPTTWYSHPEAPAFFICSRCYADHIWNSPFRSQFQGGFYDDNKVRTCRFSKPRVRDYLFPKANSTGSLQPIVDFMRYRSAIPDCGGGDGVKADAGTKWLRARHDEIPGFVACQACYEDLFLAYDMAAFFEPAPPQSAKDMRACSAAIPFIWDQYKTDARTKNWNQFVAKTKLRLNLRPCPGSQGRPSGGDKWFVPEDGPSDLMMCSSCFLDHVVHAGDASEWEEAEGISGCHGETGYCSMGHLNIKILRSCAYEKKDTSIFWKGANAMTKHKPCKPEGIAGGKWYTLQSNPREFAVCASCYIGILEPTGVSGFFIPKPRVPPGAILKCCLNQTHARIGQWLPKLLEAHFTSNITAFDAFVSAYAAFPQCPRDEDKKDKYWYGWRECTICPECFHEFCKGTKLVSQMTLENKKMPDSVMCEMYSSRMRSLYMEACAKKSPEKLFQFSKYRRNIYLQTVPQCRKLLSQAQAGIANQQQALNAANSHTNMGMINQSVGSHTRSVAGAAIGYVAYGLREGPANSARGIAQSASSRVIGTANMILIQEMEQKWRAAE